MKEKENSTKKICVVIGLLLFVIALIGGSIWKGNMDKKADSNKRETFDLSKFDTTKEAINGDKDVAYKLADSSNSEVGLFIEKDTDSQTALITIDWEKFSKIYKKAETTSAIRKYNIINFGQNIKDVSINGFGQSTGYETAFYLMKDGTVEYTPIIHALGDNGDSKETVLKSYGKMNEVSGVVKLAPATNYCVSDNSCLSDGSYTVLGIKSDGSFYDLGKILLNTDYYKNF